MKIEKEINKESSNIGQGFLVSMSAGRKNFLPSIKASHMPMIVYLIGFFDT